MACHYPKATALLIAVTVATIVSLTILWVDATIELARWNEKYGKWISVEVPIAGTATTIQEDFKLSRCAQVLFKDIKGDEVVAVLGCVLVDDEPNYRYSIGDVIKIRYNPSNPKEVASEIAISGEKSKLSSTIIFGTSASICLCLLFAFHIKRFVRLMQDETVQVREDDSTKSVDSSELGSDISDSDSQRKRKSYFIVRWQI